MLATHEPCSMCTSAVCFSGIQEVYFLFSYEASRDSFNIPHDLKILRDVFNCPRYVHVWFRFVHTDSRFDAASCGVSCSWLWRSPNYPNTFFVAHDMAELIRTVPGRATRAWSLVLTPIGWQSVSCVACVCPAVLSAQVSRATAFAHVCKR